MKENKFYKDLGIEDRRKIRKLMAEHKDLTQKQKQQIHLLFLKPMNDRIKFGEKLLKNEITFNNYVKMCEKITKYIRKGLAR